MIIKTKNNIYLAKASSLIRFNNRKQIIKEARNKLKKTISYCKK